MDSFRFLSASLDALVNNLLEDCACYENYACMRWHTSCYEISYFFDFTWGACGCWIFSCEDRQTVSGVFCIDWLDSHDPFKTSDGSMRNLVSGLTEQLVTTSTVIRFSQLVLQSTKNYHNKCWKRVRAQDIVTLHRPQNNKRRSALCIWHTFCGFFLCI